MFAAALCRKVLLLHDGILDLGTIVSSKSTVVASSSKLAKHVQDKMAELAARDLKVDYLVSPLCPKCQAADDTQSLTPHHRCWTCNLLRSSTWSEVVDTQRLLPLANRSHLAGAGVLAQGPTIEGHVHHLRTRHHPEALAVGQLGKHSSSVRHLCY